jgi:hypothetical protein
MGPPVSVIASSTIAIDLIHLSLNELNTARFERAAAT